MSAPPSFTYPTNGLLREYLFDSATVGHDSSPFAMDAVETSGVSIASGVASFSGTNSWLGVPLDYQIADSNGTTVSFWLNRSSSKTGNMVLMDQSRYEPDADGFWVAFEANQTIGSGYNAGETIVLSPPPFVYDTWQHVIITMKWDPYYDPNMSVDLWIDSTNLLTGGVLPRRVGGRTNILVVGSNNPRTGSIQGRVENLRISSYLLTPAEITNAYQEERTTLP